MRQKTYPAAEQLKVLDYRKGCKCKWQSNCYGLIVRGVNPECRVHDTFWQKVKTYLKQTKLFVLRNRS